MSEWHITIALFGIWVLLRHDGISLYFAVEEVERRVREDHSWRVIDGRYVCTYCQERKGQVVNE